jgi:hypothetical protein
MANKLTKEKLDLLIEQVLSEKIDPLYVNRYTAKDEKGNPVTKGQEVRFFKNKPDEKTANKPKFFHDDGIMYSEKGKLPSLRRTHTPKQLDAREMAAAIQSNSSVLDLKDVKKFFSSLATGQRAKDTLTPLKAESALEVFYDYFLKYTEEGDKERQTWNATISILNQRKYKTNVEKVLNADVLKNYYFPDTLITTNTPYQNNYAAVKVDPVPAVDAPEVQELPPEAKAVDTTLFDMNILDVSSETGEFPAEIVNTCNALLGGKNLYERLQEITEFSNVLANPSRVEELPQPQASKYYSSVIMQDYLNKIIKNMDERSGAYLFESFLAMLSGGKVVGGDTSDDSVTDFEIGTTGGTLKGSAKYYSDSSGISQAKVGFDKLALSGKHPVHYIIALKEKEEGKIRKLKIHYFKVLAELIRKYKSKPSQGSLEMVDIRIKIFSPQKNGALLREDVYEASLKSKKNKEGEEVWSVVADHVNLGYAELYREETTVGTLDLLVDDEKQYKTVVLDSVSKLNANFGSVVQQTSNIQQLSNSFNQNLRQYIQQNEVQYGDQSIEDFNETRNQMQLVFNKLSEMGFATTKETIAENKKINKKSLKDLDKLIERVIIYNMNK